MGMEWTHGPTRIYPSVFGVHPDLVKAQVGVLGLSLLQRHIPESQGLPVETQRGVICPLAPLLHSQCHCQVAVSSLLLPALALHPALSPFTFQMLCCFPSSSDKELFLPSTPPSVPRLSIASSQRGFLKDPVLQGTGFGPPDTSVWARACTHKQNQTCTVRGRPRQK